MTTAVSFEARRVVGGRGVLAFFFQAEDGIRDYKVTGVQTCALPILPRAVASALDRVVHELALRKAAALVGADIVEGVQAGPVAYHDERLGPCLGLHRDRKSVV